MSNDQSRHYEIEYRTIFGCKEIKIEKSRNDDAITWKNITNTHTSLSPIKNKIKKNSALEVWNYPNE